MPLTKIQDIESYAVGFGSLVLLSADNSTLLIFSEITNSSATASVYKFNKTANKFSLFTSSYIEHENGFGQRSIIAQDGSYFISAPPALPVNTKVNAALFKINTTDKSILPIYKVCEFGMTDGKTFDLVANGSSDYLTLTGRKTSETMVWDSDIINYRHISSFKNTNSPLNPYIILSDDGSSGIYIYKGEDGFFSSDKFFTSNVLAVNFNGKNSTVSQHILGQAKEDISLNGNDRSSHIKLVRNNTTDIVAILDKKTTIKYSNNSLKAHRIGSSTEIQNIFSVNYNGGFIANYDSKILKVFRINQNKTNQTYFDDTSSNLRIPSFAVPAVSDLGYLAASYYGIDNNNDHSVVKIYQDTAYPNYFVPSAYPFITDKDLINKPANKVADTNKFIVTYTYRS